MNIVPFECKTDLLTNMNSTVEALGNQLLQDNQFREPAYKTKEIVGFVPVTTGEFLVHNPQAMTLAFKLRVDKRSVPKSQVDRKLAEALEDDPELDTKSFVSTAHDELLQVAFPRTTTHLCWYDAVSELLYVEAGSRKQAEGLTEYVRSVIGSLELEPMEEIGDELYRSLHDKSYAAGFRLGEEVEMVGEDKDKTTLTNSDLYDLGLIGPHYAQRVTKLGLEFKERSTFVLTDDFCIKKLKTEFDMEDDDMYASIMLLTSEVRELMEAWVS